jgi:hypothetical protein
MSAVLNPYPPYYRAAFAFSGIPYPHPRQPPLRLTFPVLPTQNGWRYGLTVFRMDDSGRLGVGFIPAGVMASSGFFSQARAARIPFWSKPFSIFGLFGDNETFSPIHLRSPYFQT